MENILDDTAGYYVITFSYEMDGKIHHKRSTKIWGHDDKDAIQKLRDKFYEYEGIKIDILFSDRQF
jgi:hypothetical protein